MPDCVRGLVQSVKAYEELTIQAAIEGDRRLAVAALATNPLVGSVGIARAFFERALVSEGPSLGQFLSR
jgi:6-phospho-beta-glucosidase